MRSSSVSLALLIGLMPSASWAARPAPPQLPKAAQRAQDSAARYASGVYGGTYRASFIQQTNSGNARVEVRRSNAFKRVISRTAKGTLFVNPAGKVIRHEMRPGGLPQVAGATGRTLARFWNSPLVKDVRGSKNVITLAAAALASFAANQFGVPYDQVLMIATPLVTGILAHNEVKRRQHLRDTADKFAGQLHDRYFGGQGTPTNRSRGGMESLTLEAAPGVRSAPVSAPVSREKLASDLRRELGVD